jgi:hypothetical protein
MIDPNILEATETYENAVKEISATEMALYFVNKGKTPAQDGLLEKLFQRTPPSNWSWPKEPDDTRYQWESSTNCERGWYAIITTLNIHLAAIDPNYKINQIKEKFGQLCFYASTETESLLFDKLIEAAEMLASSTCEKCSRPGALRISKSGRYKTLCPECAASFELETADNSPLPAI